MKKILAVILALLLFSAALAESPAQMRVLQLDNIEINGATLAGLEARLAAGAQDGAATLHMDVYGNGQSLLNLTAQYAGGRLLVGGGSLSRTYALSLTSMQIPAQAIDSIDMIFAALPELGNFELPAFNGMELPMVRFGELVRSALGGTDGTDGAVTARIPSATLMALLDVLVQYGGSYGLPVDQVAPMLNELKSSGMGLDLVITGRDDAQESRVEIEFVPVNNGVAADAAIARVKLLSRENSMSAMVYAASEGEETRQGGAVIESDPEGRAFSVYVDAMGVSFQFHLYPRDGLQVTAVRVDGMGKGVGVQLRYGAQDGADLVEFTVAMPQSPDVFFQSRTAADAAGNRQGDLAFRLTGLADARAHARMSGTAAVSAPLDGTNAVDLAEYGASDQLSGDLERALQDMMNWVGRMVPAA